MEDRHLVSFEVSGFKKFTDLRIENIGQFNLIVGDNNVGKTTLLESLLIDSDSDKFLKGLSSIMFSIKRFTGLNKFFLLYYFSNTFDYLPQKIKFKLSQRDGKYERIEYEKISDRQITSQYILNAEFPDRRGSGNNVGNMNPEDNAEFNFNIPYVPFGALYNHELTKQYSNYVQRFIDKKEKLIESLQHIIKGIKNIEVNASDSHQPILFIAENNKNTLSPLATYGDGTVKLFRILLSLFANDHYNRLMIDELDAGVHYRRLKDFIKSLIIVAKEQKKQVFATTHSKECLEYFALALKELGLEEDGRIIRLAETKNGVKAYTNTYEQFQNSLVADSEIR
ncbi:MAG TPA: AAA family ATPase [Chitinophagaceae bacterium]|nr:AAA family ATPase [Chitinophagaceae bacterium]